MKQLQTAVSARHPLYVRFREFFQSKCDTRTLRKFMADTGMAVKKLRTEFPDSQAFLHDPDTETMDLIHTAVKLSLSDHVHTQGRKRP